MSKSFLSFEQEEITIYLERGNNAEVIGVVYGEELYSYIYPSLEKYAKDFGGIITESVK